MHFNSTTATDPITSTSSSAYQPEPYSRRSRRKRGARARMTSCLSSPVTFPELSRTSRLVAPTLFFLPPYKPKLRSYSSQSRLHSPKPHPREELVHRFFMAAATAGYAKEVLPPSLDSTAEPPALFDGATRLYISYNCPFAQRTWVARNYKGLQDKIKLVPIDLQNRPAWYKEKVYPGNKVPSLEHNGEVKGESLDLLKYIDEHFEGPSLLPDDAEKKNFAEELLAYSDSFNTVLYISLKGDDSEGVEAAYNKVEEYLSKFDDGPFFLGQFSLVDIAYAPFIERFQIFFAELKNYDITKGRPKLALWIEELNKIDAYSQTCRDPQQLIAGFKKLYGIN